MLFVCITGGKKRGNRYLTEALQVTKKMKGFRGQSGNESFLTCYRADKDTNWKRH